MRTATHITPCEHIRCSARLTLDAHGQLFAYLRCDDCKLFLQPMPEQTANARFEFAKTHANTHTEEVAA